MGDGGLIIFTSPFTAPSVLVAGPSFTLSPFGGVLSPIEAGDTFSLLDGKPSQFRSTLPLDAVESPFCATLLAVVLLPVLSLSLLPLSMRELSSQGPGTGENKLIQAKNIILKKK